MLRGQKSRLTREGWYYVAFTLFILGGAALREVNLLVVMGGLMVAPLVFGWRYGSLCLRGISVRRRLPQRVFAGVPAKVTLSVSNQRRNTTSWLLQLDDTITLQRTGRWQRRSRGRARCIVHRVDPRSTVSVDYRIQFNQRGAYRFGPLFVSTMFPLGLVRSRIFQREADSLLVLPQIGRLLPGWSKLLESDKIGLQRASNRHGHVDGDYYGLRDWQSGDNRRWIHWRTTARKGTLSVRQFERQNKSELALVVDPWVSANSNPDTLELAISLAATVIVNLSREGVNQLAFGVADGKAMFESHSNHRTFTDKLLERLATTESSSEDSALASVLAEAQNNIRLGTKLVVISTRPNVLQAAETEREKHSSWDKISTLVRATWIDCSSDEWKNFYRWEEHAPS